MSFAGQVVIVTGAAAGIGRAVALAFADAGADVTVVDVDAAGLEELASAGGPFRRECADLSDRGSYSGLVDRTVNACGRLDVLVNNAADVGRRVALTDVSADEWTRVLETNLTAPFLLTRDAARVMAAAGGGAIVNVGSIQAALPLATHVPYVSSKGGLEAMTRAAAVELGPLGIRVNAVAPGVIATPGMESEQTSAGDDGRELPPATLTGRWGTAADVAEAVLFLASARAAHISGATLTVDGGRRLSRRTDHLAEGIARHMTRTDD